MGLVPAAYGRQPGFPELGMPLHYTTSKNWTEAEAECKKDGGHLASVTNQEIYEVVTKVAGGEYVWIGG